MLMWGPGRLVADSTERSGNLDMEDEEMAMRTRTIAVAVAVFAVVVLAGVVAPLPAWGKVLEIPNFALPPSGGAYYIDPILPGVGRTTNISTAPVLTYGATSEPDLTANCLQMTWQPTNSSMEARAGWKLTFGTDPNLINHILSLSINPPGGIVPGPVGQPNFFVGILSATIDILDINGFSCGAWDFNTDQMGLFPPANDPLAKGFSSLVNNVMNTVTINLGNGPVPGSATVSGVDRNFLPFNYVAPNNIWAPQGGNLAKAASIDFYENGLLRGNVQIPGQGVFGATNFWDHVTITPEPATLALLGLGAAGLVARRRSKK
jgi:hypothetical protein